MPRIPLRDLPPERQIALVATRALEDVLARRHYFPLGAITDVQIRDAVMWENYRRRAFHLDFDQQQAAAAIVTTALALEDA
jgi:hypothetical protein